MHDTLVTLQGNLGGDVRLHETAESQVANFRVGSTPRWVDRRTGEWVEGTTVWYAVSAWRGLARNCADSLRRGDPVVVHGRLNASTWTNKAGIEVTSFEVDAAFVGHDLNRGVGQFTRAARPTVDASQDGAFEADDAGAGAAPAGAGEAPQDGGAEHGRGAGRGDERAA